MINRRGPRIDPCGTPYYMVYGGWYYILYYMEQITKPWAYFSSLRTIFEI